MIAEKYDILKASNTASLVELVNQKIEEGWQPFGPMSLEITVLDDPTYFQTMILVSR